MKKIELKLKALQKARGKYNSALEDLLDMFQEYCDEDLSYSDFPGDGFAIQLTSDNIETFDGLFYRQALELIKQNGKITKQDFR